MLVVFVLAAVVGVGHGLVVGDLRNALVGVLVVLGLVAVLLAVRLAVPAAEHGFRQTVCRRDGERMLCWLRRLLRT
jgi:hypothetical protein